MRSFSQLCDASEHETCGEEAVRAHLVVGHAGGGDGVRERPHVVLCELDAFLLEVLTLVAERAPVLLPLCAGVGESLGEVGVVALVGLDGLADAVELELELVVVAALDERGLCGVGVDADAVLLVLLAGLFDVALLGLLCLVLLLNVRLELWERNESVRVNRASARTVRLCAVCLVANSEACASSTRRTVDMSSWWVAPWFAVSSRIVSSEFRSSLWASGELAVPA